MMATETFDFVPLTRSHLSIVQMWLTQPHVARWLGAPAPALDRIKRHIDESDVECFLVRLAKQPIGYLQVYNPFTWPDHPYRDQPPGTVGIDQFIGEEDLVGRGHGPRFIAQFVRGRFARGAPRVVTDPDPVNVSAIRAYCKAGFAPVEQRTTRWGRVLLMACDHLDGQHGAKLAAQGPRADGINP